ncbi:MAG TPA: hypothetical protein VHB77_01110, partial [Planctomycetaceae bacterium]|nr:hypothetical protein [Planctomycetaceae bacterium]
MLAAFGAASASVQGAEERADPPAQVRLRFQDEQGTPIAGVRVRFDGSGWPAYLPERRSAADAQGEVKFQLARPDHVGSLTWDAQAVAELPGYEPATVHFYAFPDARIEKVVTLPRLRTTVIRLRGPQDEPLAHVPLLIGHTVVLDGHSYSHHSYLASNERGDCEWQHGDLPEGFHIDGRPHSERFDDGPVVTVRYAQEDLPPTERLVSGTLVHADGSIAVGWRVARRAWQTGSGGGIPGGTIWNYVGVEDLRRVDAAGQFEARVQKYVIVVSPEGLAFVYELAPQTWLPGSRRLTLRIPPVRSVHAGKVVDAQGKPVAGLSID